jgi:hypothetical protein
MSSEGMDHTLGTAVYQVVDDGEGTKRVLVNVDGPMQAYAELKLSNSLVLHVRRLANYELSDTEASLIEKALGHYQGYLMTLLEKPQAP